MRTLLLDQDSSEMLTRNGRYSRFGITLFANDETDPAREH